MNPNDTDKQILIQAPVHRKKNALRKRLQALLVAFVKCRHIPFTQFLADPHISLAHEKDGPIYTRYCFESLNNSSMSIW